MPSLYGAVKSKTGELLQDSMEYCKGALQSVSRSFALTIPLVEENILGPIMVGYLEARILDTFEDDIGRREISLEERIEAMNMLMEILENPNSESTKEKIEMLKDTYFTDIEEEAQNETIFDEEEPLEEEASAPKVSNEMAQYMSAISRTVKK